MVSLIFNPFGPEKEKIEDFLKQYLDSFITWDLLLFFYNNPSTSETLSSLSVRLGRNEDEVLPTLHSMTAKGILEKKKDGAGEIYCYFPGAELQKKIEEFVQALESRDKRLAILTHVLQREANYDSVGP